MGATESTVYFIDDDPAVLDALTMLADVNGLRAKAFDSATKFLDEETIDEPGCIVVDLKMPDLTGLELQAELHARGIELPVIVISGHVNVESAVTAMRGGAIDVLTKPFDNSELLNRIRDCLQRDERRVARQSQLRQDRVRVESLTPREREVFDGLVIGLSGKQIAARMEISYRTMEKFRANVMRKMEAGSVADLVHTAVQLDIVKNAEPD
ncbi:MAG: response regulator transcription factor [Planctomycetaceae bacterium]